MLGSSKRNAQREGAPSTTQSAAHLSLARFDGNRDPIPAGPAPQIIEGISNNVKNIDVGATMWGDARGARHVFQGRQPASKLGRDINIQLNAFPVTALPSKPIYQYSVMVGDNKQKRGLIKKVWSSQAVKTALGEGWIFDGQSLAWSNKKIKDGEARFNVDLDKEPGAKPRAGRSDQHRVIVKYAATIDFTTLNAYLSGTASHDKSILQAITVLDHIMRESPSSRFISIKRSFFAAASQRNQLGGHVEHTTGVYQSLRIAHHPGGARLVVNADVANGTFWAPGPVSKAVLAITGLREEAEIARLLVNNNPRFLDLRRLKKLRVYAAHRKGEVDDYIIDYVMKKDSSHPLTLSDGSVQTVAEYFKKAHNILLRYPAWPVVQMTKKNSILPLELLKIKENTRYTFKLNDIQTAAMIKRAVTYPRERWASISNGVNMLNWGQDLFLHNYGMQIQNKPIETKARLLPNPKLQFGGTGAGAQADPRTTGRWDLKSKKFASVPPANVFTTWGVCVVPSRTPANKPVVEQFVRAFIQAYAGHGAALPPAMQNPAIHYPTNTDPAEFAREAFTVAGNKHQKRPQILMFILQNKDSITYGRIKRFCECNLGIPSQCVQYGHVQKGQAQYISNVLMKFNAKLGGFTNTAFTAQTAKGILDASTVVIGADVSHSAPGIRGPSMAAMTVSMNVQGTRYAAAVETNGHRVEMITDENIEKHIIPLVKFGWSPRVGQGRAPANVIYFRDGVSEGQFAQVIDQEVAAMRKSFAKLMQASPKFLVIIASKRHHVRFFPQSGGDKNSNALPGTLVESGVTQPYENDFYLCAHAAIKGTARPVHYNVLINEPAWTNDKIQTLIYEHSYQYIRATTPVSMFPAVYYAHIASLRAAHHSKNFGVDASSHPDNSTVAGQGDPETFPPLMPMAQPAVMNPSMWFI